MQEFFLLDIRTPGTGSGTEEKNKYNILPVNNQAGRGQSRHSASKAP